MSIIRGGINVSQLRVLPERSSTRRMAVSMSNVHTYQRQAFLSSQALHLRLCRVFAWLSSN